MYSNLGETDLAAASTRRAYELRNRGTEREKFYILFLYHRQVTGNLQKGREALESWAQSYPRDDLPYAFLAGWVAQVPASTRRGLKQPKKTFDLDPDNPYVYGPLAEYNLYLNRFAAAGNALQLATQRQVENPELLVDRYQLAFIEGDQAGMEREVLLARKNPQAEDAILQIQAIVLARSGHMQEAEMFWQRAIALKRQNGNLEAGALYETAAGACEANIGNAGAAKRHALAALELAKGRDVEYAAAFALALSGDLSRAQRLADDLAKRFPEDTPVQFEYLPTLRALFALARNEPSIAIEELEVAKPYDFALPGTAFAANFGGLYPAYVRGEAYPAAKRGTEAAAEFQKVLDHRGVVFADPVGVLAHLQMGRAFELAGDKAKAKSAYEDFLTLGKAPIPIYRSSIKPRRNTPNCSEQEQRVAGKRKPPMWAAQSAPSRSRHLGGDAHSSAFWALKAAQLWAGDALLVGGRPASFADTWSP